MVLDTRDSTLTVELCRFQHAQETRLDCCEATHALGSMLVPRDMFTLMIDWTFVLLKLERHLLLWARQSGLVVLFP